MKKGAVLGLFLFGFLAFFYFDLDNILTVGTLKRDREALLNYTDAHFLFSAVLYIVFYSVQTALALPAAAVLTLAGGFLFGPFLGTLYTSIGATSGATLAFLASRYLFRSPVERWLGHHHTFLEKLAFLEKQFSKEAFYYLLMIRLIPLFPFVLVNFASGLTSIRVGTYVLSSAIGMLPATFVLSYTGGQLQTIQSVEDLFSLRILSAFVLLGLLALAPVLYKNKVMASHHEEIQEPPP